MGGKGGKGKKRKNKGGGKGKAPEDEAGGEDGAPPKEKRARNDIWREQGEWELKNDSYEAYYRRQGVCAEEDFPKLLQALRTGLPVAIRVNRMRIGAAGIVERLQEMKEACAGDQERDQFAPVRLSWYPHSLGWHWPGLERRTVKKDKRNAQLKKYLMNRENSGLISRQEAVSQIPALCMEIEPHHSVLDLCAAPGSKTSQMIEMMHWPRDKGVGGGTPSGLVLANELQWKRANMLVHQVQRLGSSCAMVVNADAQFFPELWVKEGDSDVQIKFDRVLADVPCSGDGTMRKTPFIWKSWTLRDGLSLHPYQLGILNRGLDLLQVGGRLVYSTCSLNPVEDEAVVAAALARHGDAVALVPIPELEGLRAASGLDKWIIQDPNSEKVFEKWEDVPKELRDCKAKMMPSMFPPTGEGADDLRKSLAHCRRLLPHLMDTGGFFVAVLEKRSELRPSAKARREAKSEQIKAERRERDAAAAAASSAEGSAAEASAGNAAPTDGSAPPADDAAPAGSEAGTAAKLGPPKGMKKITKEYSPVANIPGIWDDVQGFYGFDPSLASRFMLRTEGNKEKLFLVSESAARLLRSETRLPTRVVLCGVPALEKAVSGHVEACEWAIPQQGAAAVNALGLRRRLVVSKEFMVRLLREKEVSLDEVRKAVAESQVSSLDGMARVAPEEGLRPGSLVVAMGAAGEHSGGSLAVAAELSDDSLELGAGSSSEASVLLEELVGQPPLEEILRAPAGGAEEDGGAEPEDDKEAAADEDVAEVAVNT